MMKVAAAAVRLVLKKLLNKPFDIHHYFSCDIFWCGDIKG